jgi:hypothetical protein
MAANEEWEKAEHWNMLLASARLPILDFDL